MRAALRQSLGIFRALNESHGVRIKLPAAEKLRAIGWSRA